MEPIISPWFFYLLHVCGVANAIAITLFIIAVIFAVFAVIGWIVIHADEGNYDDKCLAMWRKFVRRSIPVMLVCALLIAAIPSRKTVIWMIVTKHITTDSVQQAIDAGDSVREVIKQDILELIGAIKTEESKDKN
jgi:hypothetical protein